MNTSISSSSTTAFDEVNVLIIGGRVMICCTYVTYLWCKLRYFCYGNDGDYVYVDDDYDVDENDRDHNAHDNKVDVDDDNDYDDVMIIIMMMRTMMMMLILFTSRIWCRGCK
jgi:hypothetical protein